MPNGASNLFHVIQDHRELSERLETLEQSLGALDPGSPASVEIFCHQAHRFIAAEREHMTLEEGHLYPSAVHRLTPEEWSEIDRFMANEMDPLFGDAVASPYEKLKGAIVELDDMIRPPHSGRQL
jgi:hemerythrin-like domain-containing protein